MSDTIVAVLITGAVSLIVHYSTHKSSIKDFCDELDKRTELSDEKISGRMDVFETKLINLTNEVKKHNSIIERTYELEKTTKLLEEKVKVANHRIEDLEHQK